jgi:hypothetical protein
MRISVHVQGPLEVAAVSRTNEWVYVVSGAQSADCQACNQGDCVIHPATPRPYLLWYGCEKLAREQDEEARELRGRQTAIEAIVRAMFAHLATRSEAPAHFIGQITDDADRVVSQAHGEGVALGAAAVQGLHAQAKPKA